MTAAAVVAVVLLVGLAGPVILYYLVRAEHDDRERMDRKRAERAARRDTADSETDHRQRNGQG